VVWLFRIEDSISDSHKPSQPMEEGGSLDIAVRL
jgi:hypothetical protein